MVTLPPNEEELEKAGPKMYHILKEIDQAFIRCERNGDASLINEFSEDLENRMRQLLNDIDSGKFK